MIVDLMRNDLSRVAGAGSVAVPDAVRGRDLPDRPPDDLDRHRDAGAGQATRSTCSPRSFPAARSPARPRVRAMQAIAAIEGAPRGVYTGAIGRIDRRTATRMFNVAIRTLTTAGRRRPRDARARLGHRRRFARAPTNGTRCLAKGAFLTAGAAPLRPDRDDGVRSREGLPLLERHLARMKASAEAVRLRVRPPRRAQRIAGGDLPAARRAQGPAAAGARRARSRSRYRRCRPPPADPIAVRDRAAAGRAARLPAAPQDQRPRASTTTRARAAVPSRWCSTTPTGS